MNNRYVYVFFSLILLSLFLSLFDFDKDVRSYTMIPKMQLHMDGFCVGSHLFSNTDLHAMDRCVKRQRYKELQASIQRHPKLTQFIQKNTSKSHVLQDYIWVIEKSHVNTCHRDNNGDFFNDKQIHPSYTMLIFLEDMDKCLTVYAGSHAHKYSHSINFTTPLQNIICKKGDIIIFNANLIHVGALNIKNDHTRIQMKITHKNDLSALSYYQNFHKVANKETHVPRYIQKVQRSLSCAFPIVSDLTQKTNIETSRGSDNGAVIPPHQKVFSFIFYGNSDFYDLPNAF